MSRRKNLLCEGKIMFPFATKSPAIPTLNKKGPCLPQRQYGMLLVCIIEENRRKKKYRSL